MENIRSEISSLRNQTNLNVRSQSVPRALNSMLVSPAGDKGDPSALTNPTRVKKLTKFFGDEPPLLRLFLKKLGYEVRTPAGSPSTFLFRLFLKADSLVILFYPHADCNRFIFSYFLCFAEVCRGV